MCYSISTIELIINVYHFNDIIDILSSTISHHLYFLNLKVFKDYKFLKDKKINDK